MFIPESLPAAQERQGAATFDDWAARGFACALLPIIPPGAKIAPGFTVPAAAIGKMPGAKNGRGDWTGRRGWQTGAAEYDTDAARARWQRWGASIGVRAERFPAVDIDEPHDAALSAEIAKLATKHLGRALSRVGAEPKQLLPYRLADGAAPIGKRRIEYVLNGKKGAVELLGAGQQYVIDGTHPRTGRPYAWPQGRPASAATLAPITGESVDAFFDALAVLLEMWGADVSKQLGSGAPGTDRAGVDQASLRAPSAAALAEVVAAIPNGADTSRETWINVGIAIRAAAAGLHGLNHDGSLLWEEWSLRWKGGTNDPADLERRWAGFTPPFAIGWDYLARLASAAGWEGAPALEFTPVPGVDAVARHGNGAAASIGDALGEGTALAMGMRAPLAPADAESRMFERYIWVEEIERFFDTQTRELPSDKQLSARHPEIGSPRSLAKCAATVFMKNVSRRRYVRGITYRPGGALLLNEPGKGECVNTWRPSDLRPNMEATDADVRPYREHLTRIIFDEEEREHILDWLAFIVQRPGEKINHALVIGGGQGIGKDTLFVPIVRALGAHNVRAIGVRDITGGYTDWAAGTRLVQVQEMHTFTRVETMEALKPYISDPPETVRINTKFVPQYVVPNIQAYVFFTNRRDALALENDDRRFFVVWSEAEAPPMEYFDLLYQWFSTGGAEMVAGWLLRRDLSKFNPKARAPWTRAKGAMRRESLSDAATRILDGIECFDLTDLLQVADVQKWLLLESVTAHGAPDIKATARAMRDAGAVPLAPGTGGIRMPMEPGQSYYGPKARVWALRDVKRYQAMKPAQIGAEYLVCWDIMQRRYFSVQKA